MHHTYLSKTCVAASLGVTEKTIDQWVDEAKLPPPIVIGGTRRWKQSDLEDFLDKQREASK